MTVNRHKYFRWTKRTAFLTTMYVVVVPATLGYFGYITDVSGLMLWVKGFGLMMGRASGICVARGGETRSLSSREGLSGEELSRARGQQIASVYMSQEMQGYAARFGRMNLFYVSEPTRLPLIVFLMFHFAFTSIVSR